MFTPLAEESSAAAAASAKMVRMTDAVPVEDAVSIKEQARSPLYADRVRVYPKRVAGSFRRIKWMSLIVLLGIYYILPWVRWDRGPNAPDQAVLIDLANERAYFFFIEIWPQEVYYLTGLLILAAVGLFLMTSLAGRVWCGYTCPQTVWTDLFMLVERLIEGDRNARIKLDKAPVTARKAGKKVLKHVVWLIIAVLTGGAWIMYFQDARTVVRLFFTGEASAPVYAFVGLFAATTYLLAGWAREQVCTYMCPWPRFQAAMFDQDTLVVTYQTWRGEPRGKHIKQTNWEDRGDCVDCNQCVAVCPTGIDIRDGAQLECIGCALCIDACNGVMAKVGRPANLITYDTERNQENRAAGRPPTYRLLRPRTILYAGLLVAVGSVMLATLLTRGSQGLNVLHDRSPLFVTLSDGGIRNGYTVKALNKSHRRRTFVLTVNGLKGATLRVVGQQRGAPSDMLRLTAQPDGVAVFRVLVTAPRSAVRAARTPVTFVLTDNDASETVIRKSFFQGPGR